MLRRSPRKGRPPTQYVEEEEEMEVQEEAGGVSPSQTEDSSDEWRSLVRGQGRRHSSSSSSGSDAASDAPASHSPKPQQAWKTEADPDPHPISPPRFLPKRTPGVQPPLDMETPAPGDIFGVFFDSEVLKVLCVNTNKYTQHKKKAGKKLQWISELTPQELKKYLGMLLFMSVCNFPKMTDFWRVKTIFHIPLPATVMSRNRFLAITSNLHMSDPEEDAANEQRKGTEEYDPLQKVRCLLEMMRTRCKATYHPRQHISVDERMVATKARVKLKQYMRAKPTRWGLKFFVLADTNGYTVDYRLYTGRNEGASGKGLSFDVVSELVNKDYLGSGYIVYCDNFYTSPLLFRHLTQQGFGACGTYRQGGKSLVFGTPQTSDNALDKKSQRGSIRWMRDGDLLFVKWMDAREVTMCTTVHPVYTGETVLRWQKTSDGLSQRVPIPRPTAVGEYNKYMGGVDTSDQMLGTNSVHRKTRRWPMTVFQHLVDIAATNSYILHKDISATKKTKPMTRQAFQEKLCAELLGVPLTPPPKHPTQGHFPVPTSRGQSMEKRQRASLGRKQCTVCKRSTPWKCEECGLGLCLQLDRNCFKEFHTYAGL